jgi:hypothetical protein
MEQVGADTPTQSGRESLSQRVAAELSIPGTECRDPMAEEMDLGSATYTKMLGKRN